MADHGTPMTDSTSRHSVNRFDPTETPESDPVPTGEDVVNRQKRGHQTPRRYDEALDEEKGQGTNKGKRLRPERSA